MKEGGAAKGELVLAMYELANSFRHGWGVEKDPIAARSYYETAANLGDTDAMNEVARCYEEGFGGKKDKVSGSRLFWQLFFSFLLWLVFLFYLIHSRGFGGKGFTTSSSFSWDWREVFFFFGAMREGRIPKTREASHDFILISISFFSISRRRIGWVATCGISHPLKSIYLFYEARQTHKFWVVGQQCVFSLPAIKKKNFPRLTSFFFFV